jgi:NhaP-type Na+/H+ or K+/H+ antiporter
MLDLSIASALLLAAVLAPTDPVLASDVQVGPPKSGEEDETRFSLTSEAGLNDGLAFPFVMCAIALAGASRTGEPWFLGWLGHDVVWRISVGIGVGALIGYALGWIVFRIPNRAKLSRTGDGFVALGITVIVYGIAELLHGYGFLSVFVSALALRAAERNHDYHEKLHDFAEQLERLLMMVMLVLFGGAITSGLLNALTWEAVAYSLIAILVVRPMSGLLSLVASPVPATERLAISFFGIRGIGSIYYLAYAAQKESFDQTPLIWSTVSLIILISIILHGVTVTPAMRLLDRRRKASVDRSQPNY